MKNSKSNRIILALGAASIIPIFVSTIINTLIGITYWLGNPSDSAKFYMGKFNNEMVAIIGFFGIFGLAFVVVSMQIANRHSSNMNRLDDAIEEYHKATDEMKIARDKYTEQLIKK